MKVSLHGFRFSRGKSTLSKNCVPVMEPSLLSVRHSTKMRTSKLEPHSSLQPHFMHMYFSMELLPMPAGA